MTYLNITKKWVSTLRKIYFNDGYNLEFVFWYEKSSNALNEPLMQEFADELKELMLKHKVAKVDANLLDNFLGKEQSQ